MSPLCLPYATASFRQRHWSRSARIQTHRLHGVSKVNTMTAIADAIDKIKLCEDQPRVGSVVVAASALPEKPRVIHLAIQLHSAHGSDIFTMEVDVAKTMCQTLLCRVCL